MAECRTGGGTSVRFHSLRLAQQLPSFGGFVAAGFLVANFLAVGVMQVDAAVFRLFRIFRVLQFDQFVLSFRLFAEVYHKTKMVLLATGVLALIM